jgi:hypothetical protein
MTDRNFTQGGGAGDQALPDIYDPLEHFAKIDAARERLAASPQPASADVIPRYPLQVEKFMREDMRPYETVLKKLKELNGAIRMLNVGGLRESLGEMRLTRNELLAEAHRMERLHDQLAWDVFDDPASFQFVLDCASLPLLQQFEIQWKGNAERYSDLAIKIRASFELSQSLNRTPLKFMAGTSEAIAMDVYADQKAASAKRWLDASAKVSEEIQKRKTGKAPIVNAAFEALSTFLPSPQPH